MTKETDEEEKEVEEESLQRHVSILYGRKPSGNERRFDESCQCRKLSYVVYCTVCVPVYCPTCIGRKCAESTVGSTQLSYAYGSVLRVYELRG